MLCFWFFCTFEMSEKITQTKKVNWFKGSQVLIKTCFIIKLKKLLVR